MDVYGVMAIIAQNGWTDKSELRQALKVHRRWKFLRSFLPLFCSSIESEVRLFVRIGIATLSTSVLRRILRMIRVNSPEQYRGQPGRSGLVNRERKPKLTKSTSLNCSLITSMDNWLKPRWFRDNGFNGLEPASGQNIRTDLLFLLKLVHKILKNGQSYSRGNATEFDRRLRIYETFR